MSESSDRWSVNLEGELLLGRYRVERMIGGGGMANVFLAQDEQLEIPVVVKVPHTAFLAEAGFRERFDRETRDLVTLQHPHIVRILARGEHQELPFLVMQFLKGGSLGDRMRKAKGAMPFADVEPWMRDVARALDFIHEQGVVHRDIKPDNVLFDEYGHAYLSDFGIAKAVGGADTGLTITGATPGSPAFMAPEQARTNTLTGVSDQYSFAATLYEALSGRPTFEGETVVDVLIKKQSTLPMLLTECAPQVPAGVSAALMRGLARTPEERFETCLEMIEAMYASATQGPVVSPAPVAAPASIEVAPAPTTVIERAPVAPALPVKPTRTTSVGRTLTLGGTRKAMWVVLAVLIGGPLVVMMMPGDDGSDRAGRALDGGDLDGTELAAAPSPSEDPPAGPGAELQHLGARADVVGEYALDIKALEARMESLKPRDGKRMRPPPGMKELARMLGSGFELGVKSDGSYELQLHPRGSKAQVVRGSWKLVDKLLEFQPPKHGEGKRRPAGKRAPEVFRARPAPGGLYLIRRGQEVFLKRR